MDNLETLKGIGRATAERLVKAGINTFALLASATDEQLQAIPSLPGDVGIWAEWRKEAGALTSRPLNDAEIAELVAKWEAARTELQRAGDIVSELQGKPETTAEELAAAQQLVIEAEAVISSLVPLPPGVMLPPAAPAPARAPETQQRSTAQDFGDAIRLTLASPSPAHTPQPTIETGGGNMAAPAKVSGMALTKVLYGGRWFEPGSNLELPEDVAVTLIADRAFLAR